MCQALLSAGVRDPMNSLPQPFDVYFTTTTLQRRESRLRKLKQLPKGHTAGAVGQDSYNHVSTLSCFHLSLLLVSVIGLHRQADT